MPLEILQATEYFLPDSERGIERFVYELSRGLMGDNGRKLAVSRHAWGTAVSQYMSLYEDAVKA